MLELLTAEEMGRADRLTIEGGKSGASLMESAGRGVADEVSRLFPAAETVAVLCGPGNNGGDGFVAARHLLERGYGVRLGFDGDPSKLPHDAAKMAELYKGAIEPLGKELFASADVIIDGLFGAGLDRPVKGKFADLIAATNESGVPIVAVDVPSGIDGTSGAIRGIAVRAVSTVTFFRRKLGHLLMPGRLHCGPVRVVDIGIENSVLDEIKPNTVVNEPALWLSEYPWPTMEGHKYLRGHAVIASGPMYSTGAARLAARGALRAGAGLVTVASPRDALTVNAAQLTAVMVREVNDARGLEQLLSDERKNAFLIGPGHGVGEDTRAMVLAALKASPSVVLDADALTSFADEAKTLFDAIKKRKAPVVLTPHEGEFVRLFGEVPGDSKVDRTRAAAARSGATIVLKGADTVIGAPDGKAAIDAAGTPWLATAGSGDVLGGMILAMLAQGMTGFLGGCAGVWLHGKAAKLFGPGLIAEDLPEMVPEALRALEQLRGRA